MRLLLISTGLLTLAACTSGERANKPDDQEAALESLSSENTPDNEAAVGQAPDDLTTYEDGNYTPDPAGNQYDRR